MSTRRKDIDDNAKSVNTSAAHTPTSFRPVPCGEVDYDLLYEEVTRKYPKIVERLAR